MEIFSIYSYAKNAAEKISQFLLSKFSTPPVLLCLGTDRMLADCLGAMVATDLRNADYPNFIYGGLAAPITHQSAQFCHDFIHTMHPSSPLIIIDSMATTEQARLGHISINSAYVGAINSLDLHADLFIYGISSLFRNNRLCAARLNNIFSLNSAISDGIKNFTKNIQKINKNHPQQICLSKN